MEQAHAEAAEVMKLSPQFSLEAGSFRGDLEGLLMTFARRA